MGSVTLVRTSRIEFNGSHISNACNLIIAILIQKTEFETKLLQTYERYTVKFLCSVGTKYILKAQLLLNSYFRRV